jgi:hypothetical protein
MILHGTNNYKKKLLLETRRGSACADYATHLYPQKLALSKPTSGGRLYTSLADSDHGVFVCLFVVLCLKPRIRTRRNNRLRLRLFAELPIRDDECVGTFHGNLPQVVNTRTQVTIVKQDFNNNTLHTPVGASTFPLNFHCRSQWPRGLTLRSWVRIPLRHGCLCVFCVRFFLFLHILKWESQPA